MKPPSKVVPIDALFDNGMGPNLEADPRPDLHSADIIFVFDWMTKNTFPVYGRRVMEEVIRSGRTKKVRVLTIGLDQETAELEKLLTLVQVIKGRHEYPGQPRRDAGK